MESVDLFGVRVDAVTLDEAVERALMGERCVVFTPNALMLDACRREPRMAEMLNCSDLSLADGAGVLLAARRRGSPLPVRVAGIDFGERLIEEAASRGLRVFLLGGREGVAEEARERLCKRHPNLTICGTYHGYFAKTGDENDTVCAKICEASPDVLIVCFGFPAQEEWILSNLEGLPSVRVAAGLGGSLDVWAGHVRRAPRAVQALRLEWAWRMLGEPKRLRGLPALLRIAFLK